MTVPVSPVPDDVLLLETVQEWFDGLPDESVRCGWYHIDPALVAGLVSLVESERVVNRVSKDRLRAERDDLRDRLTGAMRELKRLCVLVPDQQADETLVDAVLRRFGPDTGETSDAC